MNKLKLSAITTSRTKTKIGKISPGKMEPLNEFFPALTVKIASKKAGVFSLILQVRSLVPLDRKIDYKNESSALHTASSKTQCIPTIANPNTNLTSSIKSHAKT